MSNLKEKFTYGYNAAEYKKFKKYAWLMLLSFGFTYMFFYNGRQNINLVMTHMKEAFSSDLGTLGVVTSALFWCYAFGQLVSGRLGALIGYKKLMMMGVAASAVLNVTISFQNNLAVIAVLWGLNGFVQAMVWANGVGVLNKWWPKEKRGLLAQDAVFRIRLLARQQCRQIAVICIGICPQNGVAKAMNRRKTNRRQHRKQRFEALLHIGGGFPAERER